MKDKTIIKLDYEFTVQSDPYCWILKRETFGEVNPKTGKPKRSLEVAYLPNLLTALTKYLDSTLKCSSEVLEMFTRLSAAERNIEKALRNLEGTRIPRRGVSSDLVPANPLIAECRCSPVVGSTGKAVR